MYKKRNVIGLIILFFTISTIYYFSNKKDIFETYSLTYEIKASDNKSTNSKNSNTKTTKNNKESVKNEADIIVAEDKKQVPKIKVYITGEVNKPGVYSVDEDSRVEDLINLAEGVTKNADLESINLALIIHDEEHIVVPNKTQENKKIIINNSKETINNKSIVYKNNECKNTKIININTASIEELKNLKGIGPVIAKNIVEYREKNGEFKKIEDIKNVKRIGDETFKKIKNNICIK